MSKDVGELQSRILNYYPFLIAYPFKKGIEGEDKVGRMVALLETFNQTVRYLAVSVLAAYLASEQKNNKINAAVQNMAHPDFSWSDFLKMLIAETDLPHPFVAEVKSWYKKVEEDNKMAVKEIVDYRETSGVVGLMTNLSEIRKSLLATMSAMTNEEVERYLGFCQQSLEIFLSPLDFFSEYPLYWMETKVGEEGSYEVRRLTGADSRFKKMTLVFHNSPPKKQVFLYSQEHDDLLNLHPLLLYQDCYYCIRQELENPLEVFLVHSPSPRRIFYTGAIHHVALREPLAVWQERLVAPRLTVEKVPSSVKDIWEISFQVTEQTLKELRRAHLLEQYLPRKRAQFSLESFVHDLPKPIFLVTGPKGVGKTTLLAEMARRWSSRGEFVFFFRVFGRRGQNLEDELGSLLGMDLDKALALCAQTEAPKWIIILDGVEASAEPDKLLQALATFTNRFGDQAKIIISLEEMAYHVWKNHLELALLARENSDCPWLEDPGVGLFLDVFSPAETQTLYSMMLEKRLGPLSSFDSFQKPIKAMLANAGIMRTFFWCLQNREVPQHMGLRDVLEGFAINRVAVTKERRELISKIGAAFLEEKTLTISLDQAAERNNALLLADLLGQDGHGAFSQLLEEGILEQVWAPAAKEVGQQKLIRFPLKIVEQYLLYRDIALAGQHGDDDLAGYFTEISRGHLPYIGVVFFALLRLSDKLQFERLTRVIAKAGDAHPIARSILVEVLMFKEATAPARLGQGGPVEGLIEAVLASPFPEGTVALAFFAKKMYNAGKFALAAYIFERLIPLFADTREGISPVDLNLLAGRSYQYTNDGKRAVKFYKRALKSSKKLDDPCEGAKLYSFLGRAYRELGELEQAVEYLEQCQKLLNQVQHPWIEVTLCEDFGCLAEKRKDLSTALLSFKKQYALARQLGHGEKGADASLHLARVLTDLGNHAEAIEHLQEALEMAEEVGDVRRAARVHKHLGELHEKKSEPRVALRHLTQALAIQKEAEDQRELADTYLALGRICEQLEQEEESKRYFTEAMTLLKEMGDEEGLARCYERFGSMALNHGDYDLAMDHYHQALDRYQRLKDTSGMGTIHNALGMLYKKRAQIDKALHHYEESLRLRREAGEKSGCAQVLNQLAMVMMHKGDFASAFKRLDEAENLYQEIADQKGSASVQCGRGILAQRQGNNSEALEYFLKSMKIFEVLEANKDLGAVYNHIGLIYKERSDFHQALAYFEKGAKIQEAVGDTAGLAASYNNMGLIYDAQNDYEKALEYYTKDLELTRKRGDQQSLATSYNNIAILHYNHRNYARALWYLEKAIPIYESLDDQDNLRKAKERIQYVKEKL